MYLLPLCEHKEFPKIIKSYGVPTGDLLLDQLAKSMTKSMQKFRNSWQSLAIHGNPSQSMEVHVSQWKYIEMHGNARKSIATHP